MPLVIADRVLETSTSTGNGTITLAGAVLGYQSFSAIGNGNTTYYTIAGVNTSEWEVGIGTYTSSGTTLSRDTVLASSAGGTTKVSFSAGLKNVFVTYPAGRSVYEDDSLNVTLPANLSVDGNTTLGNASGDSVTFNAATASTPNGLNFDSNTLVIDATNNRIGVGTTAPRTDLELYQASTAPVLTFERGTTSIAVNDVYGGIDFYGNDASTNASGVRARIQAIASDVIGGAKFSFAAAAGGTTTLTNRLTLSSSGCTLSGATSITSASITSATITKLNDRYNLSAAFLQTNADTQTDVDITFIFGTASTYTNFMVYMPRIDVVGNYWADYTSTTATARLFKSWAQGIIYTGTTYSILGAVLCHTAYNSDATNFPAGAVNASKVLTVVSATQVLIRFQNRTSAAAASGTDWVYSLEYFNYYG